MPGRMRAQGNLRTDLVSGSGWDQLVLPMGTCVSYAKDLAPLAFNAQARPPLCFTLCCFWVWVALTPACAVFQALASPGMCCRWLNHWTPECSVRVPALYMLTDASC